MSRNSQFLLNEVVLINKAVSIAGLSDLAITVLIKRCSAKLRQTYFSEIVNADYLKPLGYLNSVIDIIYK